MQAGVAAVRINYTITMSGTVRAKQDAISAVTVDESAVASLMFDVSGITVIVSCGLISGFVTVGKLRKGAAK